MINYFLNKIYEKEQKKKKKKKKIKIFIMKFLVKMVQSGIDPTSHHHF